jgi:hypothetical protein
MDKVREQANRLSDDEGVPPCHRDEPFTLGPARMRPSTQRTLLGALDDHSAPRTVDARPIGLLAARRGRGQCLLSGAQGLDEPLAPQIDEWRFRRGVPHAAGNRAMLQMVPRLSRPGVVSALSLQEVRVFLSAGCNPSTDSIESDTRGILSKSATSAAIASIKNGWKRRCCCTQGLHPWKSCLTTNRVTKVLQTHAEPHDSWVSFA